MKNIELLVREFGEYGVPYEVAKNMDCFKIHWNTPFEDAKKTIKNFLITGVESKEFLKLDAICVMEFGSLDIEFMSYGATEENKFDTGFFCCVQYENQIFDNGYDNSIDNGWSSEDFADLIFEEKMLDDKENLEKLMYESLMRFGKSSNFTWSKRN